MTAVFHVHSHLLVGGGTSGHIGPLPGRDSDAARTHAATRGAGETRAAGLADLRLGYARPSADQTGHPTCRWPANFAVARHAAPGRHGCANRAPHWHRPASNAAQARGNPCGTALTPGPTGRSRYPAGSLDRSVGQTPWPGIARRN